MWRGQGARVVHLSAWRLAAIDAELASVEQTRSLAFQRLTSPTTRDKATWLRIVEDSDCAWGELMGRRMKLLGQRAALEIAEGMAR